MMRYAQFRELCVNESACDRGLVFIRLSALRHSRKLQCPMSEVPVNLIFNDMLKDGEAKEPDFWGPSEFCGYGYLRWTLTNLVNWGSLFNDKDLKVSQQVWIAMLKEAGCTCKQRHIYAPWRFQSIIRCYCSTISAKYPSNADIEAHLHKMIHTWLCRIFR